MLLDEIFFSIAFAHEIINTHIMSIFYMLYYTLIKNKIILNKLILIISLCLLSNN